MITTADGSKTIQIEDWNEQYHSIHGAIQEANHVFINHGLLFQINRFVREPLLKELHILEMGFGTGLNTLLTLIKGRELGVDLRYTGIEAYPVASSELESLNYVDLIDEATEEDFKALHGSVWEEQISISPNFSLLKQQTFFQEVSNSNEFDLIYYDAFGARVQPDLWTEEIFEKMYAALKAKGALVTYSAKGSVRRALKAVGFEVERLPGPPGKREMLRARKVI